MIHQIWLAPGGSFGDKYPAGHPNGWTSEGSSQTGTSIAPTVTDMEAEYLRHGVPLTGYQLTKADHCRQQEAVQDHEWVQHHVSKAPPWSDEHWEEICQLFGPPTPPWELQRWRLRLYCGHVIEVTRNRKSPRPDGGVCDKERCPECGLDPVVIVAFEPLGPVAEPPAEHRSQRPSGSSLKPPADRRSKAELVAENNALRAELEALRDQA